MRPEDFWQTLRSAGPAPGPPFGDSYPATLPDGQLLDLPIRALPDGDSGLASLIINQASFKVQSALVTHLAGALEPLRPDLIVGLPTLGLAVAAGVAAALGHTRYVACSTSRKFWFDAALSVPMSSVTTPASRRLYLDPRLVPLLTDRRVVLVDDVISTGTSIAAGVALLRAADIEPVGIGAIMLQTECWRTRLGPDAGLVAGVFTTPMLIREGDGWQPVR